MEKVSRVELCSIEAVSLGITSIHPSTLPADQGHQSFAAVETGRPWGNVLVRGENREKLHTESIGGETEPLKHQDEDQA